MTIPTFTGRYASIRKDVWKGTLGKKYDPDTSVLIDGKRHYYKTETGFYKAQQVVFKDYMVKIDKIEMTTLPIEATLVLKHGSRGIYGVQWRGDLKYTYGNNQYRHIIGDPTTGTGYDKLSTAFAKALNESPEFLKILMDARAKKKDLPYGAYLEIGKPWLPYYKGGVGMSSLDHILRTAGYGVTEVPVGSDDVYINQYVLKKRRA